MPMMIASYYRYHMQETDLYESASRSFHRQGNSRVYSITAIVRENWVLLLGEEVVVIVVVVVVVVVVVGGRRRSASRSFHRQGSSRVYSITAIMRENWVLLLGEVVVVVVVVGGRRRRRRREEDGGGRVLLEASIARAIIGCIVSLPS